MAEQRSLIDSYAVEIDGQWGEPENGPYDNINPATEAVIASAPDPSPAQVDSAIAAARAAFDNGPWADAGPEQRAACLNQLGAAFTTLNIAELATHPVEEKIDAYGAAGTTLLRYEPLGVVSILTPWNFPHFLNVMKVSTALDAGNNVVLKPSPLAPLAVLALARIIDEHTDIPPGVVNVVTPSSIESNKMLTVDPRI